MMYHLIYRELQPIKDLLVNHEFLNIHESGMDEDKNNDAYVDEWAKVIVLKLSEEEIKELNQLNTVISITEAPTEPPILLSNDWVSESIVTVPGGDGPSTNPSRQRLNYWNGAIAENIRNFGDYRHVSGTIRHSAEQLLNLEVLEGYTGEGVTVGVVDGGYVMGHPNNSSDITVHGSYNPAYPGGVQVVSHFHTTVMISIICANSSRFKGIAPNVKMYAASFSIPAASISWLVQQGASIINCSFFNPFGRDAYTMQVIRKATNDGVIICVAVGNNTALDGMGNQSQNPLSTINGVVAVREFKGGDWRTYDTTSHHYLPLVNTLNKDVDFCLPINAFGSTMVTNATYNAEPSLTKPPIDQWYLSTGGTSCSCAYLTGIFALLKEKYPNVHGKTLIQILKNMSTEELNGILIPKL